MTSPTCSPVRVTHVHGLVAALDAASEVVVDRRG
jgi:hypothetical protein